MIQLLIYFYVAWFVLQIVAAVNHYRGGDIAYPPGAQIAIAFAAMLLAVIGVVVL